MDNYSLCARYSLDVIRAVMQETQVPAFPEQLTLEALYDFAKLHNVEALVYYGLCQLELNFADSCWNHWENRIAMLLAQGAVQLHERDVLFEVLTKAGIPLLPVKGCWLKENYPNPEYRQMSDLDMLIPAEKAQKARKIMLSLDYTTETFENSPNHASYLKPPYTEVELHTSLLSEDGGYYDDVWNRVQKVESYPFLYRFSGEDEYIFYLLHLNKHLEDAGTGIRSILDCLVYRTAYPDMNRDYLKQELEGLHLWKLAEKIETLSDCWFRTGEKVPRELETMAESILAAGSYGRLENRFQNRLEKLEQKYQNPVIRGVVYWIARICRPRKEMEQSYPVLRKLPVLLPVFWIWRAVRKFGKNPKEIWHHVTVVFGKREENG